MLKKSLLTMSMVAATVTLSPMATTTVFAETHDNAAETPTPAPETVTPEADATATTTGNDDVVATVVSAPEATIENSTNANETSNTNESNTTQVLASEVPQIFSTEEGTGASNLTSEVPAAEQSQTETPVATNPDTITISEEPVVEIDSSFKEGKVNVRTETTVTPGSEDVTDTEEKNKVIEKINDAITKVDESKDTVVTPNKEEDGSITGETKTLIEIGTPSVTSNQNAAANSTLTTPSDKPFTKTEVITNTKTVISKEVIHANMQGTSVPVDEKDKDIIERDGKTYQASTLNTTVNEKTPGSKVTETVTTTTTVNISGLEEVQVVQESKTTIEVLEGEKVEKTSDMTTVTGLDYVTPIELTNTQSQAILTEITNKRTQDENKSFEAAKDVAKNPDSTAQAHVYAQKRTGDTNYYDFTGGKVPTNDRSFDISDKDVRPRATSFFNSVKNGVISIPQYIYPTNQNSDAFNNLKNTTGNNGTALHIDNATNLFFLYNHADNVIFGDAFNAVELAEYLNALKGKAQEVITKTENTDGKFETSTEYWIIDNPKTAYIFSAYVLKRENDGLHIDGILLKVDGKTDPNSVVQFTTTSQKTITKLVPFSKSYSKTEVQTNEEITAPKVTKTVSREYKLIQDDNTTPDGPVGPVDPTGPAESGDVTPAAPIVTPAAVDPITVIAPAEDDSMVLGAQRLLSTAEDATFTQDADEPMVLGAQRDLASLPEAEVSAGAVLGASRNATTGDDSAMGYYVYAILASGAGLLLYRRKKENI